MKKNLWEYEPGALANHPTRAVIEAFSLDVCRLQLQHYDASGDPVHLQRAYRVARAFGDLTPAFLALLQPHLDDWLAGAVRTTTRADQRQKRTALLLDYYHELRRMEANLPGCAASKDEIYRRLAKRFGVKSPDAVEQQVLKQEGRDGRRR